MCGIAGVIDIKADTGRDIIHRMTECMIHRGPDASGYFIENGVALGHRRLSIIDLSDSANQPFKDNNERFVIVFNGEIYNFKEIKILLKNYDFHTNSDTEVIIASYIEWGMDCISHFKGMFSIAIWDRVDLKLTLIRDRLGVKPLYYYNDSENQKLYFASEIRAILASGQISKNIDQKGLHDFLTYQSIGAPYTLIEGVKQLRAGHYLEYYQNRISIISYWSLLNKKMEFDWKDENMVHHRIKELLTKSVERRLVSDVSIGAFLSGGIDSSAIVGLMSSVSNTSTNTFNISFDEEKYDESHYADIIAKKFRTNHTRIKLRPRDFINELDTALKVMDTPSGDGINTYVVSKAIRDAGITVALSGIGGDELFAGYPIFKQYSRLNALKSGWKTFAFPRKVAGMILNKKTNRQQRLSQILNMPIPSIEYIYPISRQLLTQSQIDKLTNVRIKSTMESDFLLSNAHLLDKFPLLSQVTIAELNGYTQQTLLKDTDQMGMAVSLEVREPFFDHDLVAFVLSIPDNLKEPEFPKSLLVKSLAPLLPDEIVYRKKKGFTFPWDEWMKNELREFCTIRINRIANRDFIHGKVLKQSWYEFINGSRSMRWSELWLFIVLEEWLTKNGIE